VILPIELTTEDIRNTKAYKEYYACATGKAAPKPKASARRKREAEQLKIVLRRSRQETHISQHGGFGTDEENGSKPGVLDVPSDDSEEDISWNTFDDEDGRGLQVSQDIKDSHVTLTPVQPDVFENLPTFDSVFRFEDRVKSLEVNFLEFMQTNQFAEAVSKIPDSFQRENDEFLRTIDENMKKIIKEQVKSQVKEQVSRILPRIEESVNAQLEAEVL
nr:hypothetical protein [Tanacetum cinerariifolium]